MNYFFAANFALLLGSIFSIRSLVIQWSGARPIIAPVQRGKRNERTKNQFYMDYFYITGAIYSILCGLLFLLNCIETWLAWGLFAPPDAVMIAEFLFERRNYYYFLAAVGLVIAFLVLPERTTKLRDAQAAFFFFSLTWLSVALLSVYLSK